jgi:hypothetical protein
MALGNWEENLHYSEKYDIIAQKDLIECYLSDAIYLRLPEMLPW